VAGDDSMAGPHPSRLSGSIRNFAATLLAAARTRLALLANELHAERLRVGRLLVLSVGALFFFALSVVLLTVLVIAICWDTYRFAAIGGFALAYIIVGLSLAFAARAGARTPSRLFEASLRELRKDADRLSA